MFWSGPVAPAGWHPQGLGPLDPRMRALEGEGKGRGERGGEEGRVRGERGG